VKEEGKIKALAMATIKMEEESGKPQIWIKHCNIHIDLTPQPCHKIPCSENPSFIQKHYFILFSGFYICRLT
jgi:hypothetical protein